MVIQIKNLSCNKTYSTTIGGKEFEIKNIKDIYRLLRIRDKITITKKGGRKLCGA